MIWGNSTTGDYRGKPRGSGAALAIMGTAPPQLGQPHRSIRDLHDCDSHSLNALAPNSAERDVCPTPCHIVQAWEEELMSRALITTPFDGKSHELG